MDDVWSVYPVTEAHRIPLTEEVEAIVTHASYSDGQDEAAISLDGLLIIDGLRTGEFCVALAELIETYRI